MHIPLIIPISMFTENFTPPKPRIAERETVRRIKIIESIIPELSKHSTSILLTGTMAYGQDYSIWEDSPITIELTTTSEMVAKLASCKFFQKYNISRISEWFTDWIFQQFTLSFMHKEITVDCHFWDEKNYKEILAYKKESVIRLRSQTKKTYIDHAHSFDGEENICEYPDYKNDVHNIGVLPVHRIKDKKIFLSRPLTDILWNAIVLFDECGIAPLIVECRNMTEEKIAEMKHKPWKTYSIFNALPEKEKIAEDVKIMLI